MSKYTISSILFLIILLTMILVVQYDWSDGWILAIPIGIYIAALVIGSVAIGFNFYFFSFCKIKTKEKIIAITFDDGPDPSKTRELANLLYKHKAVATFFCIGNKISEHSEIIKKLDLQGHAIGNHSFTHHRWFDLFSSKKMAEEIIKTNEEIKKTIGKQPLFFRPPFGVTNPTLAKAVEKTKMASIGWSLRSFDTMHEKDKVMKKLISKTTPGKIILFHDTTENILEIMAEYLGWLKSNGFNVVSLEQMFNIQAYEEA